MDTKQPLQTTEDMKVTNVVLDWKSKNYVKIGWNGGRRAFETVDFKYHFWTDCHDHQDGQYAKIEPDTVTTMKGKPLSRVTLKYNDHKKLQQVRKVLHDAGHKTYLSDVDWANKFLLEGNVTLDKDRHVLYFDIETDMCNTPHDPVKPITAVGHYSNRMRVYEMYVWREDLKPGTDTTIDGRVTYTFNNEKDMMIAWFNQVEHLSPDILAGWYSNDFDVPYIMIRAERLGIGHSQLSPVKDTYVKIVQNNEKPKVYYTIKGLETVDLITVYQKLPMAQPASYKLDEVARFQLGEDYRKYAAANPGSWRDDITGFIEYLVRDVELVRLIDEDARLLDFLITLQTEIVPMRFDQLMYYSMLIDNYCRYTNKNLVFEDISEQFELDGQFFSRRDYRLKFEGGRVLDPVPGKHENVAVLDFAKMYPSIYKTFNVSPDTVDENGEIDFGTAMAGVRNRWTDELSHTGMLGLRLTNARDGFVPEVLDTVLKQRSRCRKEMAKLEEGSHEWKSWNGVQLAYKELANSIYGVMGFPQFRFFDPRVATLITKIGRMMSEFVEAEATKRGARVIYGDTDSIMVAYPGITPKQATREVEQLVVELNLELRQFTASINKEYLKRHALELEFEKLYPHFYIGTAKKRYMALNDKNELKVKGFEIIRKDTPGFIRVLLHELFVECLKSGDPWKLRAIVEQYIDRLKEQPLHDVASALKLTQDPEEYTRSVMHARAAAYSNAHLGTSFRAGDHPYILPVHVASGGLYPTTDIVAVEYNMTLPPEFTVDYEAILKKHAVKKLAMLEHLPGFDYRIVFKLPRDLTLADF